MQLTSVFRRPLALTLALAVTALLPAAAHPALAQDQSEPERYELLDQAPLRPGDVITKTASEKSVSRTILAHEGEPVHDETETVTVAYTTTTKVLAVDEQGRSARSLVHFRSWQRTVNNVKSSELVDAVIEVRGRAADRSWTARRGAADLNAATRTWLDDEFGADENEPDSSFAREVRPDRPVAIGDEWTPDIRDILKSLDVPDSSDVTATARLVRDGEIMGRRVAWVRLSASLPFSLPDEEGLNWEDGATTQLTVTGTVPLVPGTFDTDGEILVEAAASGTLDSEGKVLATTVTVRHEIEGTVRAGGEFPDLEDEADSTE